MTAILTCLITVFARAAEPAPGEQGHDTEFEAVVARGFRLRDTDHFTIAYDTSYEALRPLVGRLEGTYDSIRRFCETRGLGAALGTAPLEVILFNRFEEFAAYAERLGVASASVAGFYHQQTNVAAFCHSLSSPSLQAISKEIERATRALTKLDGERRGRRANRTRRGALLRQVSVLTTQRDTFVTRFNRIVIQHETAHQLLFNLGVHGRGADNPGWLVEGLACQFEVPQSAPGGVLKRVNQMRLADFREALGVPSGAKKMTDQAYREAVELGRYVPVIDLIADRELFAGGGEIAFRYAQAWALVYYLERRFHDELTAYLKQTARREPGDAIGRRRSVEEFRDLFGEPDDAFDRAWIRYMLKLRFDPVRAGR